jgi:hypothetical protein
MYPVALELQADSTQLTFETLRAAIGSLISNNVAIEFRKGIDGVRKAAQGKTGRSDKEPETDTADMFINALKSMGMSIQQTKGTK